MRAFVIAWLLSVLTGCAWEHGSAANFYVYPGDPAAMPEVRAMVLDATHEVASELELEVKSETELAEMGSAPREMLFWSKSRDVEDQRAPFSLCVIEDRGSNPPTLSLCVRVWSAEWWQSERAELGRDAASRLCRALERRGLPRMEEPDDRRRGYCVRGYRVAIPRP